RLARSKPKLQQVRRDRCRGETSRNFLEQVFRSARTRRWRREWKGFADADSRVGRSPVRDRRSTGVLRRGGPAREGAAAVGLAGLFALASASRQRAVPSRRGRDREFQFLQPHTDRPAGTGTALETRQPRDRRLDWRSSGPALRRKIFSA